MGDLGWRDDKGRIWFCGRKSHRVITEKKTLYTIPCEAIINNHKRVFRSALVGVGPAGRQKPVICIELHPGDQGQGLQRLLQEVRELATASHLTEDIEIFLIHPGFPVDIRHNSKIFREKLAVWAEKKLR
jgi:acyl-coenzyme A synthetase/AMP-(fatty) acid ligase